MKQWNILFRGDLEDPMISIHGQKMTKINAHMIDVDGVYIDFDEKILIIFTHDEQGNGGKNT